METTRRGVLAALAATTAGCAAPTGDERGPVGEDSGNGDTADPEDRTELASRYTEVYEEVAPSVVRVRVYADGEGVIGQGSGFVYGDGHVVTNHHVVDRGDTVRIQYRENGWRTATPTGTDPYTDLAVFHDGAQPDAATALATVTPAPPVGTEVLAIGSPFGLGGSVTRGIVSGRNRSLPAPNGFTIPDAVQTDAAVNPGNSGGPLVALDGSVVGVVTAGQGENVGFAISAALVDRVVPELIETGTYEHSYMGIRVLQVSPLIAEANGLSDVRGAYVTEVVPDGPSDGVLEPSSGETTVEGTTLPTGGDVIVGLDGEPVTTQADLSRYLALETTPGDELAVTVLRDGSEQTVAIELGSRPDPNGG